MQSDGITAQERYRALLVLENLPAIERWRSGLSEARRRQLNHPNAIWAAWKQATATEPRRCVLSTKPAKGYGRAVHWPQDALQRAADAIREARSGDCIVMAKGGTAGCCEERDRPSGATVASFDSAVIKQ